MDFYTIFNFVLFTLLLPGLLCLLWGALLGVLAWNNMLRLWASVLKIARSWRIGDIFQDLKPWCLHEYPLLFLQNPATFCSGSLTLSSLTGIKMFSYKWLPFLSPWECPLKGKMVIIGFDFLPKTAHTLQNKIDEIMVSWNSTDNGLWKQQTHKKVAPADCSGSF